MVKDLYSNQFVVINFLARIEYECELFTSRCNVGAKLL